MLVLVSWRTDVGLYIAIYCPARLPLIAYIDLLGLGKYRSPVYEPENFANSLEIVQGHSKLHRYGVCKVLLVRPSLSIAYLNMFIVNEIRLFSVP